MANTTVGHDVKDVYVDALAGVYDPKFPPAWAVPVAAATLWDAANPAGRPAGPAHEGPEWYVSVAPGRIRIGHFDPARAERRLEKIRRQHGHRVDQAVGYLDRLSERDERRALWNLGALDHEPLALVDNQGPEVGRDPLSPGKSRSRIVEWSAKSRRNMLDRFSTLDYEPLVSAGVPAMVTATMGEGWQLAAPNGKAFKSLVRSLGKRYFRAWGAQLVGLWKLEFQRRGAPHMHMLIVPPAGEVDGMRWRQWFAVNWTDLVIAAYRQAYRTHPLTVDFAELRRRMIAVHEHRKASADYAEGLRATDPKRIAVYFMKHNLLRDKEYQHVVPEAWQGEGDGPGRFWGFWGLQRADKPVPVSDAQAVAMARTLRRWQRAKRAIRISSVVRIDERTGLIRRRSVRRRLHSMRATSGFLVVNDGPAVALMLAATLRT